MTRRYLVRGRVQGVGFRWFVQTRATQLGLGGWVRNLPDGTVEVEASGGAEPLAALEAELRTGPRNARVDKVDATEISGETEQLKSFEIR